MGGSVYLHLFIFLLHFHASHSGTSPIVPEATTTIHTDDIPLDKSALPKEILEQLARDEIIEEIVVVEENKKQVIDLRNSTISADPIPIHHDENSGTQLLQDMYKRMMSSGEDLKESPRRFDPNQVLAALRDESTTAFFRNNNLRREDFLKFLINSRGNNKPPRRRRPSNRRTLLRNNSAASLRANFPGEFHENGIRCIPKVIHVHETVYERGMKCHHSYQKKCHMTYITDYAASNEQKCETSFKKNCHITFKPVPASEKVNICHTPLVRKCDSDIKGPEICSTQYEDNCETKYKTYEVDQDRPKCKMVEEVRCTNVTVELFHLHAHKPKKLKRDYDDDDEYSDNDDEYKDDTDDEYKDDTDDEYKDDTDDEYKDDNDDEYNDDNDDEYNDNDDDDYNDGTDDDDYDGTDDDYKDDSKPDAPHAVQEKCEKWPVQKCKLITETVTKVHPETSCEKIPRHICIPSNCITVKGKEVCHEEMRTQVQNLPQEDCDLQPEQNCRIESTLVPRLVPKNNCLKVPKEICVNTKKNPKIISKPIVKQWCYKPDELDSETVDF